LLEVNDKKLCPLTPSGPLKGKDDYMIRVRAILLFVIIAIPITISPVFAWHDETHLAIAKAAGYKKWYNCTGADITKLKAGSIEDYNHWFDNGKNVRITPELVREQVRKYNNPNDTEGHLYGAIVGSLQEYDDIVRNRPDKYAEYNLAFFCHYVGDLSQPFHNLPYDQFNKSHHKTNDGIVENDGLEKITRLIKEKMKNDVVLRADHFEEDLINEVARVANKSRELGAKLRKLYDENPEKGDMTRTEVFEQLAMSSDLLRAVIERKNKSMLLPQENER
jgi:hypothetical protein